MDHEPKSDRRLAAIMATDVVGYSKLMQSDEAGALAALAAMREATQNQIRQHRGRVVNTAGDSVLAEFSSAVEAVSCATTLQEELSEGGQGEGLQVRIGIHIGDVVDKDGDLFGTSVNVAARLEGIAQPGGIVISAAVRDAIAGKLPASFTDLGLKSLKNIEEPLRAYALSPRIGPSMAGPSRTGEALPLPNKPSIAVLPFGNLSADRDQEYFADGMVEEIITALSRFRGLFVIARNSSFVYKGRAVDVKHIGRELGVRYILEGSIRKAGSRLRINGQLIDTATGAHLWADRFDGGLEDIFDLQDQVTASVVGAIAPKLEQAEIERTKRKPTANLDAYDYYLRGLSGVHEWTDESTADAIVNFRRAIELDPHFAAAYGMAARCYVLRKSGGWMTDHDLPEVARLARRAAELGKDDAVALGTAGLALSFFIGLHEDGKALTDRAISLNPNFAMAYIWSGWVRVWLGETEAAVERVQHALRLNPNDHPHSYSMFSALAFAHFFAGRHEEAASWAEMAVCERPDLLITLIIAAASSALAGRLDNAARALAQMRQLHPTLGIHDLRNLYPVRRPEDVAKMVEGLRQAGLPE